MKKPAGWAGFFGLYFHFIGLGEIVGQKKQGLDDMPTLRTDGSSEAQHPPDQSTEARYVDLCLMA
jgi:hypothetical protein